MRHRVAYRKLGRVTEHRIAMLRGQAEALLRHERIRTTVPKAKELRPFVERLISIAKRSVAAGTTPDAGSRLLHARRLVLRDIPDRDVVAKLFDTLAPRFAERKGGYTRLLRLGYRRGDAAAVAQVELVGSEYNPKKAAEPEEAGAPEARKAKGVGGRLRAAAERIRGSRKAKAEAAPAEADAKRAPRGSASAPRAAKKTPQKKST
jgi:large subunit ribosomal protein L17